MPYVQVELEAIKNAQIVAGVVQSSLAQIVGGLTLLWQHCWANKVETVHPLVLGGLFGLSHQQLPDALEAAGFIERVEDGLRVRGAARYLRIQTAKSEGGKKRATGANRGSAGRFKPAPHQHHTSTTPAPHQQPPALTQNTDHLASKDQKTPSAAPTARAPAPQDSVIEAWRRELGKDPALPVPDAYGLIGARLKERFTIEQLCLVPVGARIDAERWPERATANEFKFLFGSAGQVRKFIELSEKGNPGPPRREPIYPEDRAPKRVSDADFAKILADAERDKNAHAG